MIGWVGRLALVAGWLLVGGCVIVPHGHRHHHGPPHGHVVRPFPRAKVVKIHRRHVHTARCGHFHHRGVWYFLDGHHHGQGCGHALIGGHWVLAE